MSGQMGSASLSRLMSSLWVPQAIFTAAALGIADVLAEQPTTSDHLAATVGAHPGALHRLLRGLVALELCTTTGDGTFALTRSGAALRPGTTDSVRSSILLMGSPMLWGAWGRLIDCVRSGESIPQLDGWETAFDFREIHPAEGAIFDHAMAQMTRRVAGSIAAAYDFTGIVTLVDVGGGSGALLPPILETCPGMRATVFDLPGCRDGALRLFAETDIAARCDFVAGSFFDSVSPAAADAYVVKSVLHDWDDTRAVAILRTIRNAMAGSSRLLVIEPIAPDRPGSSPHDAMIAATDLNMLIATGGRERTPAEFRTLLGTAGLHVTRVVQTPAAMSIIEARRT